MRSFVSGLLTLIAVVASVVAVPGMWIAERLVDEDGFISVVTPMASDDNVKTFLADQITDQVVSRADQIGAGQLDRPIAAVAKPVAQRYTESPGFREDFVTLVRQQHSWLFDEPQPGAERSVMRIDITPMVNRVVREVFPAAQPVPGPIEIELVNRDISLEAGHYHRFGNQITLLAWTSTIVAVVAGILALLFARRRGTVLAWLGIGLVLSCAAAWAAGALLGREARSRVSDADDTARKVADLFIDRCAEDLTHVVLIVGGVGVGLVVLGVIVRLVFPGTRRRRDTYDDAGYAANGWSPR